MKKNVLVFGFLLTLFLSSCTQEVDSISTASLGEEENLTVVITKGEDIILKTMVADIEGDDIKEQIQLIFDSKSYVVLNIDDAEIVIGNDIYHMVNSENEDRMSSYDVKVIDKKLFVINKYRNVSSDHEDVDINCYQYVDGEIVEVWDSNALIDLTVTENEDAKQMVYISNKDFDHEVTLDETIYSKIVQNKSDCEIRCSLGDSMDYRFIDYDGDGRVELLVKGKVKLENQTINPFYRVYKISETIDLENCGFNDDIDTERYFN